MCIVLGCPWVWWFVSFSGFHVSIDIFSVQYGLSLSLENLLSAKYSSSAVSKLLNMQKMLLDLLWHKNSVLSYRRKDLFCLSCPGIAKKKNEFHFSCIFFLSFFDTEPQQFWEKERTSESFMGLGMAEKDWRRRNLLLDARDLWSTRQELLWKPRESCWWCFFWETIIVSYEREVTKNMCKFNCDAIGKKKIFLYLNHRSDK